MKIGIKSLRDMGLEGLGAHIEENLPANVKPGIQKPGQVAPPVPATPPAGGAAPAPGAGTPPVPEGGAPPPAGTPPVPPKPLAGSPVQAPHIPKPEGAAAPVPAGGAAPAPGAPVQYEIHTLLGFDAPNEDFSTPEQVQTIFKRGQESETISNDLASAKTTITGLEEKLNSKLNPYASDAVAEFNHFVKESKVDNYGFFNTLKNADLDKMDPMEIQLLKREMDSHNGQFHKENARKYLEQSHGLAKRPYTGDKEADNYETLKAEHDRGEQSRVDINMEGLQFDANKSRAELKELKGHIKPMDLKAEQDRQLAEATTRNETLSNEWGPHVDQSTEKLRKLSLGYKGQNNAEFNFGEFELPQEAVESIRNEAMSMVVAQGKNATAENIKQLEVVMVNEAFLRHKDLIFEKFAKNVRALSEEEFGKMYSNPSGASVPHPHAAPAAKPGQAAPTTGAERMKADFEKHQKLLAGE